MALRKGMAGMDDVWFGPGVARADLQRFMQALALQDDRSVMFAIAGTAEPTLVLADRALFRLFGVASEATLAGRLLAPRDPGGRRIAALFRTLPLEGAPRLERLRFLIGLGSEIITILCRRITAGDGTPVFVAAALGLRADHAAAADVVQPGDGTAAPARAAVEDGQPSLLEERPELEAAPDAATSGSMSVQAIQAHLHTRWPTSRTARFLWQSDAAMVCTTLTPPLAAVVGPANADVIGRNLLDVAPLLDASGTLAAALERRETWSGLAVAWPITDAPATVRVSLGAIATLDGDRRFQGFRGYGVIYLDHVETGSPVRLPDRAEDSGDTALNVVPFPSAKALSPQDRIAFVTLGAELRDQAGLQVGEPLQRSREDLPGAGMAQDTAGDMGAANDEGHAPSPIETPPADGAAMSSAIVEAGPDKAASAAAPPPTPQSSPQPDASQSVANRPAPVDARAEGVERNGLSLLDRLAIGLLVCRDSVPIFVNKHMLDALGFADEDALHAAGGMAYLFGGQPGNVTGSEAIGVRGRDGVVIPANARVQSLDWDGLPATMLTLQQVPHRAPTSVPTLGEFGRDDPDAATFTATQTRAATQTRMEEAQRRQEQAPARDQTFREQNETAWARDEAELRELRAILETSADGVAVIDAQGILVSLNRSAEALFGYERGIAVGQPFAALFAPHDQALAQDYIESIRSDAQKRLMNQGCEFLVKAHQGTIPVFMTLGRLGPVAAEPEDARFCALFRDLTHWKKAERELDAARQEAERASALKADFLGRVSEEVRAPLNTIVGLASTLTEERFGPLGDKCYKDDLREIHRSSTRLLALVSNLADLSRIEAGRLDLAPDLLDVNRIISDGVGAMQPEASRQRVIMRLSLAATLPPIKADEGSLRQIVHALLSNAVKFNEPGGQVIVASSATEDGHVTIRIRDTGPGMSEAAIAAALQPFGKAPDDHHAAGGGLGLPLARALVEANGAALTIRSKVAQGTLVEVAFPTAEVTAG